MSGSGDGTLRFWNPRSGQPIGSPVKLDEALGQDAALSPDGSRIISAGGGGLLRLWDARSGQAIEVTMGHDALGDERCFQP